MTENGLEKLKLKLREFAEARDWDHFHEIISDDWFTLRPKKGGKKGRGK